MKPKSSYKSVWDYIADLKKETRIQAVEVQTLVSEEDTSQDSLVQEYELYKKDPEAWNRKYDCHNHDNYDVHEK